MSDIEPSLERETDGVPRWLVVQITDIKNGVKYNAQTLNRVSHKLDILEERQGTIKNCVTRVDQKLESHLDSHDLTAQREAMARARNSNSNRNSNPNPNSVTFKDVTGWLIRLALLVVGGLLTLLFQHLFVG